MVGRNAELNYLQQAYDLSGNQLIVLYGRSGIGKNELLYDFCKDKKVLYYAARQASPKQQREMMGEEIQRKFNLNFTDYTYDNFFRQIQSGDDSKLVFIVDAFERIVKKDPDFMIALQKRKDEIQDSGSILILLSSDCLAWVEQDMKPCMGAQAKLVTDICKIDELKFVDVVHLFPDYTVSQCVQVYGILGGVPGYLKYWDPKADIRTNICSRILSIDGPLYREAERYIGEQLRELSVYNTILSTVASGKQKLNDLYRQTEYSRAKISVYLKNLMEFEVVEKISSFETGGWDNAQKGLYEIKNTFINFWFKFVYPNMSDLHQMAPEDFYDLHVAPEMERYLERYFKKVCMEYLELMSMVDRLPIKIHKIGTWVGKQGNIDVVAQNSIRENIVALCNWSRDCLTYDMYTQLQTTMEYARIKAKNYYLFSAKSFDDRIRDAAKENEQIILIDMNRL